MYHKVSLNQTSILYIYISSPWQQPTPKLGAFYIPSATPESQTAGIYALGHSLLLPAVVGILFATRNTAGHGRHRYWQVSLFAMEAWLDRYLLTVSLCRLLYRPLSPPVYDK